MMDPQDHLEATVGQTVLVRLINAGYLVHSMHSHGFHFLVVDSDGRRLAILEAKDTLDVAPGERYELLFHLDQVGRYMFHDHLEQNTTNNGTYPGGMITMISVNDSDGSNQISGIDDLFTRMLSTGLNRECCSRVPASLSLISQIVVERCRQ